MWTMIVKKLPVSKEYSPPKMAIFWSIPWVNKKFAAPQLERAINLRSAENNGNYVTKKAMPHYMAGLTDDEKGELVSNYCVGEHNEFLARAIFYNGEKVRIFPDEYSLLDGERMTFYLFGDARDDGCYDFVPAQDVGGYPDLIDSTDLRDVYHAALLDGASPVQALIAASVGDLDHLAGAGWFKLQSPYAEIFE